jgi:hypothetical protein
MRSRAPTAASSSSDLRLVTVRRMYIHAGSCCSCSVEDILRKLEGGIEEFTVRRYSWQVPAHARA